MFDNKTKVLTHNGWKLFKDIMIDDMIATLSIKNEIVYRHFRKIDEYDYDEKMYKVTSQYIDILVTPKHLLYIREGKESQDYELVETTDIFGLYTIHKKNGEWMAEDVKDFILSECTKYKERIVSIKDWALFLGIWYSKGSVYGNDDYGTIRFTIKDPDIYQKLFEILKNLKIEYSFNLNTYKLTICNQQIYQYLKAWQVDYHLRTFPEYIWEFSVEESRCLLESIMIGKKLWKYTTSSLQLAEDIQRLAFHCGWSANMILKDKAGHESYIRREKRTIIQSHDMYEVSIITVNNDPQINLPTRRLNRNIEEYINYKEKVYSIDIDADVLYVKRNGKCYWIGAK